jgi:hypothetical protein
MDYPLLEALHELSNVPFNPSIGLRENKEAILKKYGFFNNVLETKKRIFFTRNNPEELKRLSVYIHEELEDDSCLAILAIREAWASSGGCPVVYLRDFIDLKEKIHQRSGGVIIAIAQCGEELQLLEEARVVVYSRPRSNIGVMTGFDNYTEPQVVRLGGGFRLEIDDIKVVDNTLTITCTGVFSFNDMGSRVLALEKENDKKVPRTSQKFYFRFENEKLWPMKSHFPTVDQIVRSGDTNLLTMAIVANLAEKDGEAIRSLFQDLLVVKPAVGLHQLEGIYGCVGDSIRVEIIDFDGIDSLDSSTITDPSQMQKSTNDMIKPQERLIGYQLQKTGFTKAETISFSEFVRYRQKVKYLLRQLVSDKDLCDVVKTSIESHFIDSEQIFIRDLTGPIKLARMLRLAGIMQEENTESTIQRYDFQNYHIILIGVMGFEMGYLIENGNVLDTSDVELILLKLSKITGRELPFVITSYIREGD